MSILTPEKILTSCLTAHLQKVRVLTLEDFHSWLQTDFPETTTKSYFSDPQPAHSLPLPEIITILKDIKGKVPSSDQSRLDWCIEKLLLNKPPDLEIPFRNSLIKETLDHIEEHSPLGSFRQAANDEKISAEILKLKQTEHKVQDLVVENLSPRVQFDINDFDLSIFELSEELGASNILTYFTYKAFSYWNLFKVLNIDVQVFINYVKAIGDGYKALPYHNVFHAADVLQASQVFLSCSQLYVISEMTQIHAAALLLAALIHDFKHPGVNNSFLMLTNDPLAVLYNDLSILENFHVSEAFQLSKSEDFNIFQEFSKEEFRTLRKLVISAVLGTDMTKHSKHVSDVQMKMFKKNELGKEKETIIGIILHLADLSNTCRLFGVSEEWAIRVNEEFFDQGDKERLAGLGVSALCDRFSVNIAKNQVGFLNGVMHPFITPLCREFPSLRFIHKNLKENTLIWSQKTSEYQPPHNKAKNS